MYICITGHIPHSYTVGKLKWCVCTVDKPTRRVHNYHNRFCLLQCQLCCFPSECLTLLNHFWPDLLPQMLKHLLLVIYSSTSVLTWREPQRSVVCLLTEAVRKAVWHCVDECMYIYIWMCNSTGTCHFVFLIRSAQRGKDRPWCLHALETGLISQLIHSALTKLLPVLLAISLLPSFVPLRLQFLPLAAPPIFFVLFSWKCHFHNP